MTSLFANLPEERAAALDCQIDRLLRGQPGGPFGLVLLDPERAVLKGLRYHRGSANPITLAELRERTGFTDRDIKSCVRTLRLSFRLPVGASKNSEHGGYFLILTPEDLRLYLASPLQQIRAELEVVRAVGDENAARELMGQLGFAPLEGGGMTERLEREEHLDAS